ncbi:MAG TPA: phage holin family protein [Bacteroidales bacterium]|nr:phage holin family protein [Bacteroidales bacterium]
MEVRESSIKSLLDSTEDYIKTSVELLKLKAVDKAADKVSIIISRATAVFGFLMFLILGSIALGLWLGSVLGKNWAGFLIVAGIYAVIGVMFFLTHNWFRKMIGNAIVKQAFKD